MVILTVQGYIYIILHCITSTYVNTAFKTFKSSQMLGNVHSNTTFKT